MPESFNSFKKFLRRFKREEKTPPIYVATPNTEPVKKYVPKIRLSKLEKIKIAFNLMKVNHSHDRENARRRRQIEKGMIKDVLDKTSGNREKAAKMLGISLRSLQYKIKKYFP